MRMAAVCMALGITCGFDANAQSNITLYGVVDTNIEYVNHYSTVTPSVANGFATGPAANRVAMMPGGLSGSRWGLRGTEELGGGLQALFVLESGFGVDDGKLQQGGRIFGRQAFVGLNSAMGQLTFGRQYSTMFDTISNFAPSRYATQYEPAIALLGLGYRADNSLKYVGKFGGFNLEGHWSFGNGVAGAGEVPGQFRRDTSYGGAVSYESGPLGFALVYDQYNPTLTASGATGTFKKVAGAASYAIGDAKLMGGYRWGRSDGASGDTLLRDNYYWIGVTYQVTAPWGISLAYYYDDVRELAGNNINNPWQVTFITNYSFSKRTDVYLTTAYVKNSGINFDTSAINFANGYFLGQGKNDMFAAAIGIRHKF
ncbi:porin [Cupriavidus basilensis]|uniref:Outer membrane protein (Porin) n=1 Tax=Cupriavidus basilensis TaxID=68895 RepID=A0A0C4YH62_9BURK|nr:porin [Cupriavidus basilensis]AJG22318.1 Outer membrane protein (porin) [Cupriavidus basilensis]